MTTKRLDNPALITDLSLCGDPPEVSPLEKGWAIALPQSPDFVEGNFLWLQEQESIDYWEHLFTQHIDGNVPLSHFCFKTDQLDFVPNDIEKNGYIHLSQKVLQLKRDELRSTKPAALDLTIRPLYSREDWQQWIANELLDRPEEFSAEAFTSFIEKRGAFFQSLYEKQHGHFFGAFHHQQLVGSAGLFHFNGLGRFQEVRTHPLYRNQGICTFLVREACQKGFQHSPKLYIVCEEQSTAHHVYTNIGFNPVRDFYVLLKKR